MLQRMERVKKMNGTSRAAGKDAASSANPLVARSFPQLDRIAIKLSASSIEASLPQAKDSTAK